MLQFFGQRVSRQIGTADFIALADEQLGQAAHADPTDADKMIMFHFEFEQKINSVSGSE